MTLRFDDTRPGAPDVSAADAWRNGGALPLAASGERPVSGHPRVSRPDRRSRGRSRDQRAARRAPGGRHAGRGQRALGRRPGGHRGTHDAQARPHASARRRGTGSGRLVARAGAADVARAGPGRTLGRAFARLEARRSRRGIRGRRGRGSRDRRRRAPHACLPRDRRRGQRLRAAHRGDQGRPHAARYGRVRSPGPGRPAPGAGRRERQHVGRRERPDRAAPRGCRLAAGGDDVRAGSPRRAARRRDARSRRLRTARACHRRGRQRDDRHAPGRRDAGSAHVAAAPSHHAGRAPHRQFAARAPDRRRRAARRTRGHALAAPARAREVAPRCARSGRS